MKQTPIEIPVKLGIADIRKQLKQIQGEIANTFDPEEIAKLSERAGELKDNLIRVNEQVGIYASGSPFEQSANALGLVGSQLMSLDFEGAAESAKLLQNRINSITPEQINKQMKGLTDTFTTMGKVSGTAITGIIKNVGTMARAFISFGVSLLANPIFLLVAAIVAIVVAIVALMNKLGLLKPVLEAIGKVFEFVGWVIDMIIKGLKQLTDWLGFTDNAAKESAKAHAEAAEMKAKAYEDANKRMQRGLDEQIKINQIEGKSTFNLELQKQEWIRKTSLARQQAIQARLKENMLTEEMDAEQVKELTKNLQEIQDAYKQSISDTKILKAQEKANRKKDLEDQKKDEAAAAKERAAAAKQYAADRLTAERFVKDLELENMAAGIDKELALNAEKYKRLIEDTKRNEKLNASERGAALKLLREQEKIEAEKIQAEQQREVKARIEEENAIILQALQESGRKKAEAKKADALAAYELEALKNERDLAKQLEFLNAQMLVELENTELTENQKAVIREKYRQEEAAKREEASNKDIELRKKTIDAEFAIANQSAAALQGLSDLVFLIKKSNLQKGSIEEEKAARQQFKVNKAIQMSTAIISGVQSVMSALAQPMLIPAPIGTILKAATVAATGVTAGVNIAKIASAKYEGGGSATPSTSLGGGSSSTGGAATPAFNLFGNSNNFNNLMSATSKENKQNISVKAVVVADEMSAAQETENKILKNSSL